ncbi:cytochrome C [Nitrosophilus kaiyonis]|uniref:cytochrome C n=1 Tax=Nitrosophilus kaiyonis TaxID=2930200 RepID=UPI00248FE543|nr:cytochrome C [Nitrosophilus kaiyonis]
MKKFMAVVFAAMLGLSFVSTAAFADVAKGQKLYQKKLKKACGFTGAKFAAKHTQEEWEEIYESGKFKEEVHKICPKVKPESIKDKWVKHLFDFCYEYASDSGNVPSC